jgi:hypothetical protein
MGHDQQNLPSMFAAETPRPAAAASGPAAAAFYPSVHLSFAEPAQSYPNVRLTTVEMPAGFAAPAAVAAADAQAGSSFSAVLLASTRATPTSIISPFKTDEELGLVPALQPPAEQHQHAWLQPPHVQVHAPATVWPQGAGAVAVAADSGAQQAWLAPSTDITPAAASAAALEERSAAHYSTWQPQELAHAQAPSDGVPAASAGADAAQQPSHAELAEFGAKAAANLEAAAVAAAASAATNTNCTEGATTTQQGQQFEVQQEQQDNQGEPHPHKQQQPKKKHKKQHADSSSDSSSSSEEEGTDGDCALLSPQAAAGCAGATAGAKHGGGKKKRQKKGKKGKKGRKG